MVLNKAKAEQGVEILSKSAYCMDADSKTVVYEKEPLKRLPIASMCKIMTLLLTFEEMDSGKFDFQTMIPVSAHAMNMGGSQVYLQAGQEYSAETLIKTAIVSSANDSCVALAEYIGGSDVAFCDKMNERAKQLGCNDTLFANCTGLPKEPQYSCAKDVAVMFSALIEHPQFFQFSTIKHDVLTHPDGRETMLTNTNKLPSQYSYCDGGKTGFTNSAGFCLSATAKQGDTRFISVTIGSDTSQNRFTTAKNLFEYAFSKYESRIILPSDTPVAELTVNNSKQETVALYPSHNVKLFCKKGENLPEYEKYITLMPVQAPQCKGIKGGELSIVQNGLEIENIPLITAEALDEANYFDYLTKIAKNW